MGKKCNFYTPKCTYEHPKLKNFVGSNTPKPPCGRGTPPPTAQTWALAKTNKGDYFVHDGLLYHRDNVVGQTVSQLCLPARRRAEILKLAHDVHCGHLSFRKSCNHIRLSFHWPTLKTDLLRHLQSCLKCQTRARITYRDRVPITPIPRAQTAFTHWMMDCFGPIMGSQKIEYPYCLLLCDSVTRFPWAHPLRTLSAKSVCDALLQLFSFTGVGMGVIGTLSRYVIRARVWHSA